MAAGSAFTLVPSEVLTLEPAVESVPEFVQIYLVNRK